MKIKAVQKGHHSKHRTPKVINLVADKVNIITRGGMNQPIGSGTMGGVVGGGRKAHFSYNVQPPQTSVNARQADVPPPDTAAAPAEQNLVANSLGRLGQMLGGYALDYARQSLYRSMVDAWQNGPTFNTYTDPNQVDQFESVPAPNHVSVGTDIDYVLGDTPGTVIAVDRGAQTMPQVTPNVGPRYTRSTQVPAGMGTQTGSTQTGGVQTGQMDTQTPGAGPTNESGMQTDNVQSVGLGTQTTPVSMGGMATQTGPMRSRGMGTQTSGNRMPTGTRTWSSQTQGMDMIDQEMQTYGIGMNPQITSQDASTQAYDTEMKRLFLEQKELMYKTNADAATAIALNQALGELLTESQAQNSTLTTVANNMFNYLSGFLTAVIGDTRWQNVIDPSEPVDTQVGQLMYYIETNQPALRRWIREVGNFAEKMYEVKQNTIGTQAGSLDPYNSRPGKATWQTGTQTNAAELEANRPNLKRGRGFGGFGGATQTTKKQKTSAATGPPVKVKIPKPPKITLKIPKPPRRSSRLKK